MEADLTTVLGEEKLMEETEEVQFWKMESRIKWEMMYGGGCSAGLKVPGEVTETRRGGQTYVLMENVVSSCRQRILHQPTSTSARHIQSEANMKSLI